MATTTDNRELDLDATYDAVNSQNNGKGIGHTLDGVHGYFTVSRNYSAHLHHTPSAKGRKSDAYREVRAKLGDDYTSTYEVEWPEVFFGLVEKRGLYRYKN
jgi:hypothetical protein